MFIFLILRPFFWQMIFIYGHANCINRHAAYSIITYLTEIRICLPHVGMIFYFGFYQEVIAVNLLNIPLQYIMN